MKLTIQGQEYEYEYGVTYAEIAKDFQKDFKYPIILVKANGNLRELSKKPEGDCEVEFLDLSSTAGHKTYSRGLIFVLLKALYNVYGNKRGRDLHIMHKIGNGIYGEVGGIKGIPDADIKAVRQEMDRIIDADMVINKRSVNTSDAKKMFHDRKMFDKENLLNYRRVSRTNIYSIENYEDYFYGYMPTSTGILRYYDLFAYDDGFILMVPSSSEPTVVPEFEEKKRFFACLKETDEWGAIMGIKTVAAMNDCIRDGNIGDTILVQEAFMEKKIGDIAQQIKEREGVKFVMIAGPSSSGKTTFSHRLSIQLRTLGLKPHPIGVDDYFKNREDTPKAPDGSYNFECLEAIDVAQFNEDMSRLLKGERVELPTFNFKLGVREYRGNYKQLGPDDLLVIEGIHGLNDALSYELPVESKFKIYISALTQLNVDEHNRIPTTDARLIRRIVRDARTRGASAQKTISMWPSVRAGEEENIFPFQEGADVFFNSALIYELAELKPFAEPLLFSVPEGSPEYPEAKRLLKFLDYFLPAPTDDVPKNSILREFIGGSYFNV
ncbi:MAG: nucleoside kinase [Lachnospiraceae bacterium]|nr:nucleoside kinase [Lachnospiraceae bacterium]